jgi:hypothetical protein
VGTLFVSIMSRTSFQSGKGNGQGRIGKTRKEEGRRRRGDSRENPQSVGMSQTTLPSLNSHNSSIRLNDTQLQGVSKSESDSVVYVNLPLTLWYTPWLGVVDRVNTSGEVELSSSLLASSDYRSASLVKDERRGDVPQMMGHWGRNLDKNLAEIPLVERTMMAPALCSMEAATADMARVSAVSVGRGVSCRSWSKTDG